LSTNRNGLDKTRLEVQEQLVADGTPRQTSIVVNTAGQVMDGNHGVKAASRYVGQKVDVKVVDDGMGNKDGEKFVKDLEPHGN
jgi:hypothetical protein